jgi:hypothetical protein
MRWPVVVALALAAGCVAPPEGPSLPSTPAEGSGHLTAASASFADGAAIPRKHSCDGAGASPPLVVAGAPPNASTVALLVIDPDVPTPIAPTREFVHWVLWNAPLANGSVEFAEGKVPAGAVEGNNGAGKAGWTPPCPPQGSPAHRYVFTVHAVDGALRLPAGSTREQLEAALKDHSLAQAKLTGTYARAILTAG